MKRGLTLIGTVLISLFGAASAVAQSAPERMTVDELIARALAAHPDLDATRLEVDAASARVRQAGL
jgi:outer membrane protein TolC